MRSRKPSSSCSQMYGYPHTTPHFSPAETWGINFKRWQKCLFKDKFRGSEGYSAHHPSLLLSWWHHFSPSYSGCHHGTFVQMEATPSSRLELSGRTFCDDGNILCIVQYGSHTWLLGLLKCHTLRPFPPHTLVFCLNALKALITL